MESTYDTAREQCVCDGYDYRSELGAWFLVSGDTDDFIFYGEQERTHSEK